MPGLVIFKRRWSVGSDDLIVPAIILFTIHFIWLLILSIVSIVVDYQKADCMKDLFEHTLGYIIILIGCVVVEGFIGWVSMRGSILNTTPRSSMKYLLYIRLGILLIEIIWLIVGAIRLREHYNTCPSGWATDALLGVTICNWCVVASVLMTIWCTFDAAGRSWVKMKVYQNSLKEGHSKYRYKRSGNSQRNWRHRKAVREYQDSWNRRCRLLCCCVGQSDRQQNSFTEIAKLLSEFFRDLDVVPSDVIAGLILLRRHQKTQRQLIAEKRKNDTFQFLSGVAITSNTKFLDVNHPVVAEEIRTLVHFLHYGLAVYGWPIFMMMNSATGCCQLFPNMKCCAQNPFCCCNCRTHNRTDNVLDFAIEDNCCQCNFAALKNMCETHNYEIIYATYHVAIGEPPFFVALDFDKKSIVISVRGTLSLHDVITDLNAEGELLPTNPIHEDWLGHKGMVEAAVYIKNKLKDEEILKRALNHCPEKGSQSYNIVLVGHSLGAGTAAILSILLKEEYPDLVCFAFAPPGGLLSAPALEYTKEFIISLVLGKDVVPRLGLHQMETLRFDLINAIKQSPDSKWKIIGGGVLCCCPQKDRELVKPVDVIDMNVKDKELSSHPNDDTIALTVHSPLYPPGRIIHLVRNHPNKSEQVMGKKEPVFQALWADNTNFDQIIISPVMIQDHMPDKMLDALEKLLIHTGPAKPQRKILNENTNDSSMHPLLNNSVSFTPNPRDFECCRNLVLETSFTDSPLIAQNAQNTKRLNRKPIRPTKLIDYIDMNKVDLMRDDWFGAAPLASPETMSDISSISSRSTGVRTSWGLLPVFTITDKPIVEQKPVLHQPNGENKMKYSKITNESSDELNIPLVESECQINANINNNKVLNKNPPEGRKALNLKFDLKNETIEDIEDNKNGLYELLEVKDEYHNSSSHSSDNNVQDFNSGEIHSSRCESTNENESLPTLHRFSSDTDLNQIFVPQPQPLRRSHEEIHLNNLDDTAFVFETESLNINTDQNCTQIPKDGEISPTLRMLFHKLLTIESPTADSANHSTCDSDLNANQITSSFSGNKF